MTKEEKDELNRNLTQATKVFEEAQKKAFNDSEELKQKEESFKNYKIELDKLELEQKEGLYSTTESIPLNRCNVFIKEVHGELKKKKDAMPDASKTHKLFKQRQEDQDKIMMIQFNTLTETFLDSLCRQLNVGDMKGKDMDQAQAAYEQLLNALQHYDMEEDGASQKILSLAATETMGMTGMSEEDAKALVVKNATIWMQRLVERFKTTFGQKAHETFSGVYSTEAEETYNAIAEAESKGMLMLAGSRKLDVNGKKGAAGEDSRYGIASQHAYSLIGAETLQYKGKDMKFIKVRNPWAYYTVVYTINKKGEVVPQDSEERTNGVGLIELNQFMERFDVLSFTEMK